MVDGTETGYRLLWLRYSYTTGAVCSIIFGRVTRTFPTVVLLTTICMIQAGWKWGMSTGTPVSFTSLQYGVLSYMLSSCLLSQVPTIILGQPSFGKCQNVFGDATLLEQVKHDSETRCLGRSLFRFGKNQVSNTHSADGTSYGYMAASIVNLGLYLSAVQERVRPKWIDDNTGYHRITTVPDCVTSSVTDISRRHVSLRHVS